MSKNPPFPPTPLGEGMMENGLEDVETCITQIQFTAAQYIVMRPILQLCQEAEQRPGAKVLNQWWEREGINLDGKRQAAETSVEIEEADEATGEGQMNEVIG